MTTVTNNQLGKHFYDRTREKFVLSFLFILLLLNLVSSFVVQPRNVLDSYLLENVYS
jgi:hypothetical protein